MGFLDIGTPLTWAESEAVQNHVKYHGISQLLNMWRANRDRSDSPNQDLYWGDELEYILVRMDKGGAELHLDATSIISQLNSAEEAKLPTHKWLPEFASYMVEATPGYPYALSLDSLLDMEKNMQSRRIKLQASLPPGVFVTTLAAFPRLGLPEGYEEGLEPRPQDSKSRSVFIPDAVINPHPRFGTLVQNICSRRRAKPFIQIPLFEDTFTYNGREGKNDIDSNVLFKQGDSISASAFWRNSLPKDAVDRFAAQQMAEQVTLNPVKGSIYMDCFAFGMGMSCVQTTFGAPTIEAARYLYDQLLILAPLFLALTASTPCLRGLLADTDTRWSTLEQAVDCRTEEEEKSGSIPKSRYSGASLYLGLPCDTSRYWAMNDSKVPINEEVKERLMVEGMDEALARHYGHLWIRDPMVIFSEKINQVDDLTMGDHFENIQSTNWNSVRFKPPPLVPLSASNAQNQQPPSHPSISWRVEFRTPEIQLTEAENTAQVALISVLAQILLRNYEAKKTRGASVDRGSVRSTQRLEDLYIPMTLNDVNMQRSWERDAVTKERFFFPDMGQAKIADKWPVAELTLKEIFIASAERPGLLSLARDYIEEEIEAGRCEIIVREKFRQYCQLIAGKVRGDLLTTAQYLRRFVTQHPTYKHDSRVSKEACYDVSVLAVNLGLGVWTAPELTGLEAVRTTVNLTESEQFVRSQVKAFSTPEFCSATRSQVSRIANIIVKKQCDAKAAVASLGRVTNWDVVSTEDLTYHCIKTDGGSPAASLEEAIPSLVATTHRQPCSKCREFIYIPSLRNKESFTRCSPFGRKRKNIETPSSSWLCPLRRRPGPCSCEASREDLEYYAQVE